MLREETCFPIDFISSTTAHLLFLISPSQRPSAYVQIKYSTSAYLLILVMACENQKRRAIFKVLNKKLLSSDLVKRVDWIWKMFKQDEFVKQNNISGFRFMLNITNRTAPMQGEKTAKIICTGFQNVKFNDVTVSLLYYLQWLACSFSVPFIFFSSEVLFAPSLGTKPNRNEWTSTH